MNDYSYEILDLLKKYDGDEKAALEGENSPQCLYAFSPLRENLLEWAEIEKEDRVLQIGSDYGALTGLFARRAAWVTVLDPRDENLEVNRLRHEEFSNITYLRGGIAEAEPAVKEYRPAGGKKKAFGGAAGPIPEGTAGSLAAEKTDGQAGGGIGALAAESFDYVVLAGALGRCDKEKAAGILEWAAGFLKPGGQLFAAAENEAGVRYWMGAEAFETGYLEVEFRGLFEALKAGHGGSFLLYYPVPDYRYPVAVYSDSYLPNTGDVTNISARLDGPGFWFGSEEEAMAKACQNGEFTKFANSFLGWYQKGQDRSQSNGADKASAAID